MLSHISSWQATLNFARITSNLNYPVSTLVLGICITILLFSALHIPLLIDLCACPPVTSSGGLSILIYFESYTSEPGQILLLQHRSNKQNHFSISPKIFILGPNSCFRAPGEPNFNTEFSQLTCHHIFLGMIFGSFNWQRDCQQGRNGTGRM
jgi:hypothetical protein